LSKNISSQFALEASGLQNQSNFHVFDRFHQNQEPFDDCLQPVMVTVMESVIKHSFNQENISEKREKGKNIKFNLEIRLTSGSEKPYSWKSVELAFRFKDRPKPILRCG